MEAYSRVTLRVLRDGLEGYRGREGKVFESLVGFSPLQNALKFDLCIFLKYGGTSYRSLASDFSRI
jgi:hypothetical protein